MPVKISAQSSAPRAGIINKEEMDDAMEKFQSNVELVGPVIKTDFCEFARAEILQLLGVTNAVLSPDISGLRIYFGVHPEGQQSCDGEDYSKFLNTMIFAIKATDQSDFNRIDDQMLIPGYNAFGQGAGASCCGGMGKKSGGG